MNCKKPKLKCWKKLVAAFLVSVCMITNVGEVMGYTVTTTGNADFKAEKTYFNNAKSPMYYNESETISGKIASAYNQDIYHYQCPKGGYYAFYTTGSSDTVGAVYEEENGLFSATTYELRAKNDDPYTGGSNFCFTAKLDKKEDYYVCVRCYGKNTGSYKLKIQPNEDLYSKKNYGVWNAQNIPSNLSVWTKKKIYLNKEQTLLFYWVLDPAVTVKAEEIPYTVSELKQIFKQNNSTGFNLLVSAIATALSMKEKTVIGNISIAVASFVLTDSSSYFTVDKMMDFLHSRCGVDYDRETKEWRASKGLVATYTFTGQPVSLVNPWSYSTYTPGTTQMKGEKWYVGKWSWDNKSDYKK